jgi:hypothetical protein
MKTWELPGENPDEMTQDEQSPRREREDVDDTEESVDEEEAEE